jgi:hypothetical protein
MDPFVIGKMAEIIERLDRIEKLLKNPPMQITGAPAQRAFHKETLLPQMPTKVVKEPKK